LVMTTAGGLYRYNIFDLVRCVGFHGQAPLVEFLNKGAHFSSLTGEKLSEHQVIASLETAQKRIGVRLKSYLLAPNWGDPPNYVLLVEESDLPASEAICSFSNAVEEELQSQNVEYASKRDTLRLGPVRVQRVVNGSWHEFQKRRLAQSGGTVEQYKQPHLTSDLALAATFRAAGT
jgi:GH3 auxin-responsive promoter